MYKNEETHQGVRLEQRVLEKSIHYEVFVILRLFIPWYTSYERNSHIYFQCIYFNVTYLTSQNFYSILSCWRTFLSLRQNA